MKIIHGKDNTKEANGTVKKGDGIDNVKGANGTKNAKQGNGTPNLKEPI